MEYYNLIEAFNKSSSDKNHTHKYAVVYDYVINTQYLKKGSPLNLLEIGIRGGDSIKVWDESYLFSNILGVDKQKSVLHFLFGFSELASSEMAPLVKIDHSMSPLILASFLACNLDISEPP